MKKFGLSIGFVCILAFILLIYQSSKPFWGQFDWTGAWFGAIARNYLLRSPLSTGLAAIVSPQTQNRQEWIFYNHYPILYPLMIAGSVAVFGLHEEAVRIVSILFSVGLLAAFYLFCRRIFNSEVGIFGAALVLFTPMFLYYGKLPIHEQPVLFFSLLFLTLTLSWLQDQKVWQWQLALFFLVMGMLTSWTAAYILILLTVYLTITDKGKLSKLFPAYLVVAGVIALHLIHTVLTSDVKEFFVALSERTAKATAGQTVLFTPLSFVRRQLSWMIALYTKPLILMSLLGAALSPPKIKRVVSPQFLWLALFFLWGIFQWLVVSRIAWIHDYMLIYFLPFFAFGSGLFVEKIFSRGKIIGSLALALLVALVALSGLQFTRALLSSKDQTASLRTLGLYFRTLSQPNDRVLFITSPKSEFAIHYPIHYFFYYSDRFAKYQEVGSNFDHKVKSESIDQYRYIVIPDRYGPDNWKEILKDKRYLSRVDIFSVYGR